MRNSNLWSISEFRPYAKRTWGTDFENDEAAFLDAFQNGEFKGEDGDLSALGNSLSDAQLASLFLPVCKALISGCVDHRSGPTLKDLLDCYSALEKWQNRRLETTEQLFNALAKVRNLIFKEMGDRKNAWWVSVFFNFKVLDCGIRTRMGLKRHDLMSEYDAQEARLFDEN